MQTLSKNEAHEVVIHQQIEQVRALKFELEEARLQVLGGTLAALQQAKQQLENETPPEMRNFIYRWITEGEYMSLYPGTANFNSNI